MELHSRAAKCFHKEGSCQGRSLFLDIVNSLYLLNCFVTHDWAKREQGNWSRRQLKSYYLRNYLLIEINVKLLTVLLNVRNTHHPHSSEVLRSVYQVEPSQGWMESGVTGSRWLFQLTPADISLHPFKKRKKCTFWGAATFTLAADPKNIFHWYHTSAKREILL